MNTDTQIDPLIRNIVHLIRYSGHQSWLAVPVSILMETGVNENLSSQCRYDEASGIVYVLKGEDHDRVMSGFRSKAIAVCLDVETLTPDMANMVDKLKPYNPAALPRSGSLINLSVFLEQDVIDSQGKYRVFGNEINCQVSPKSSRAEVVQCILEATERSQKFGCLQGKTPKAFRVTSAFRITEDGRCLQFPMPGCQIRF